jgi:hypothetical protein
MPMVAVLLVVPVAAMMLLTIVAIIVTLPRLIEITRLAGRLTLRLRHLTAFDLARSAFAEIIALVIAELIAGRVQRITRHTRTARHAQAISERISAALAHLLLSEAHDDAVVVFRVLHVVLGKHGIAGRESVTRQRHVLFRDVRRGAAKFHVRPRALEAPGHRILRLAIATATTAVLLSLPHWLPFLPFLQLTCPTTARRFVTFDPPSWRLLPASVSTVLQETAFDRQIRHFSRAFAQKRAQPHSGKILKCACAPA